MRIRRITVPALFFVCLMGIAAAFVAETPSYGIDSFHLGSAGGNGSTPSYLLRSTLTYEQGGNRNATADDYLANSGWFNTSFDILRDVIAPVVNLESPSDGSTWTTANTITLYYNTSEDNTLDNCTLVLNHDDVNATSITVVKGVAGQAFTSTVGNGYYNWSVNCTDNSNNIGASEVWNLTVGYSPPPGGNGGDSSPSTGEPPEIPPAQPPVEPPPNPPGQPKTPTSPDMSDSSAGGGPGNADALRNNVARCWNDTLEGRGVDSLGYLYDMVPCPEKETEDKPFMITKRVWCNGIEIGLEKAASVKVSFLNGKPRYALNLGRGDTDEMHCPWCYDGIRDYDEEGLDCGGPSCVPCIKLEEPTVLPAGVKCDDGRCDEGNEYVCPRDCRKPKRTLAIVLAIIAGLAANTGLWEWVAKKRRLGRLSNAFFTCNNLILAGLAVVVIAGYVCTSPFDCQQFMGASALMGIIGLSFVLVFWGADIVGRIRNQLTLLLADEGYLRAYKDKKEIEAMIRKGEEYLKKDPYASEVIYTAMKPLYNNLPPEYKRKVIERIRRYYERIVERIRGH